MIRRLTVLAVAAAACLAPLPAIAELVRITDRTTFVNTVNGRALTRLGVTLRVAFDGSISGRALGREVTGAWSWEGGMFCRTLDAGDHQFERNCQVVSTEYGATRFHADQGTGDIADFNIR